MKILLWIFYSHTYSGQENTCFGIACVYHWKLTETDTNGINFLNQSCWWCQISLPLTLSLMAPLFFPTDTYNSVCVYMCVYRECEGFKQNGLNPLQPPSFHFHSLSQTKNSTSYLSFLPPNKPQHFLLPSFLSTLRLQSLQTNPPPSGHSPSFPYSPLLSSNPCPSAPEPSISL